MNPLVALRIALGGGRESIARMALMASGIAVGVLMLLLTLTAVPLLQKHIDRLAWHRTTEASPATAPDGALWLAVTDRYAGHDVIRVHVAALGARPPVPPGVERLPGPGELVVSPALADMLRREPDDQLGDRFPGRVVGTIGPQGLIMPDELVGIIGSTPEEMRDTHGVIQIRGIEQPSDPLDLIDAWRILIGLLAVLIIGPVIVFIGMVTRVGGARREQRFAAIRLAGATRLQTAVLGATETAGAAIAGTLLGWLTYHAIRPLAASQITLGHGMPIFVEDLAAPVDQMTFVLLAVPVLAVLVTLITTRRAQVSPLEVRRRSRRGAPGFWRLTPIGLGLLAIWHLAMESRDAGTDPTPAYQALLSVLAPLSILVGLVLTGPIVCFWVARGFALLSRNATSLIVARRIAADPYSAFRSVSGAALAVYVAATLGLLASEERASDSADRSVLHHGVVVVHVSGAPQTTLGPLMTEGVVVARQNPDARLQVSCAELMTVAEVSCPLPADNEGQPIFDVFAIPERFNANGLTEPDGDPRPVQTLLIPTDGSTAAIERVRTLVALTVPSARTHTNADLDAHVAASVGKWETFLPPITAFVLLVAAGSLTVSAISGVLERRRPFALLRATGVRLGELRRMVMLETGVPLALTVLGSVGLALGTTYALTPMREWVPPSASFLAGLAIGVVCAFLVSLTALPFMDIATRHDAVRFE